MAQYISKSALVTEIENIKSIEFNEGTPCDNYACMALDMVIETLDTLEGKEVDLEKEWEEYFKYRGDMATVNIKHLAKHFFELGLSVNNPITAADKGMAEEIIINLKRVEQDYHIDLTREMEWLRNKTMKGE